MTEATTTLTRAELALQFVQPSRGHRDPVLAFIPFPHQGGARHQVHFVPPPLLGQFYS